MDRSNFLWLGVSLHALMLLGCGGPGKVGFKKEWVLTGHEVGNGGDAIVCEKLHPQMHGKHARMLDSFEGLNRFYMPAQWPLVESPEDKAARVISRLEAYDADRAARYHGYLQAFWVESEILPNAHLPDIPDDGPLALPGEDCKLMQAVIQSEPMFPGDKRYHISGPVWEQLDAEERATLVLHEIMYREAISLGHKTSAYARYLNAYLISDKIARDTPTTYIDLLQSTIHMPAVRSHKGIELSLKDLELDEQKNIVAGRLQNRTFAWAGKNHLAKDTLVKFAGDGSITVQLEQVASYTGLPIFAAAPAHCGVFYRDDVRVTMTATGEVRALHETGGPLIVNLCNADGSQVTLPIPYLRLRLQQGQQLYFSERGLPVGSFIWDGDRTKVMTKHGYAMDIDDNETMQLAANGGWDLEVPPVDLDLKPPTNQTNSLRYSLDEITFQVNKPEDAQRLLNGFASHIHDDGDINKRYYQTSRHGMSIVCAEWLETKTRSCRIRLRQRFDQDLIADGLLTSLDGGGYRWVLGRKDRNEGSTQRVIEAEKFWVTHTHKSCQHMLFGSGYDVSLRGDGFEICRGVNPPYAAIGVALWPPAR